MLSTLPAPSPSASGFLDAKQWEQGENTGLEAAINQGPEYFAMMEARMLKEADEELVVSEVDLSARPGSTTSLPHSARNHAVSRRRSVRKWKQEFQEDSQSEMSNSDMETEYEEESSANLSTNFSSQAPSRLDVSTTDLDPQDRAEIANQRRIAIERSQQQEELYQREQERDSEEQQRMEREQQDRIRREQERLQLEEQHRQFQQQNQQQQQQQEQEQPQQSQQKSNSPPQSPMEDRRRLEERQRAEAAARAAADAARLEAEEAEAEAIRQEEAVALQQREEIARQQKEEREREQRRERKRVERQHRLEQALRVRDDLTREEQKLAERERYIQERQAKLLAEKQALAKQRRALEEKLKPSRIAEGVLQQQINEARLDNESQEAASQQITELERSVAMLMHQPPTDQRDAQLKTLQDSLSAAKLTQERARLASGRFGSGMNGGTSDRNNTPTQTNLKPMSETPTEPPSSSRGCCGASSAQPRCVIM